MTELFSLTKNLIGWVLSLWKQSLLLWQANLFAPTTRTVCLLQWTEPYALTNKLVAKQTKLVALTNKVVCGINKKIWLKRAYQFDKHNCYLKKKKHTHTEMRALTKGVGLTLAKNLTRAGCSLWKTELFVPTHRYVGSGKSSCLYRRKNLTGGSRSIWQIELLVL